MSAPPNDCPRCGGAGWVWLHATAPGGAVQAVEASCPTCCGPSAADVLDWRAAHHWSARPLPCRHCAGVTNLRDYEGRPAHKTCATSAAESPDPPEISGGVR
jgi:DnaJ-class molecular chaperone